MSKRAPIDLTGDSDGDAGDDDVGGNAGRKARKHKENDEVKSKSNGVRMYAVSNMCEVTVTQFHEDVYCDADDWQVEQFEYETREKEEVHIDERGGFSFLSKVDAQKSAQTIFIGHLEELSQTGKYFDSIGKKEVHYDAYPEAVGLHDNYNWEWEESGDEGVQLMEGTIAVSVS